MDKDQRSLLYSGSRDSVEQRPAAIRWCKYRTHNKGGLK
jgi:hypothetical protein